MGSSFTVHVNACGQSIRDALPGFAAIARAVNVRIVVFQAMAIDGGVSFIRVEMRRLHH